MYSAFILFIAVVNLSVMLWGLLAGQRLHSKLVLFNAAALGAAGLTALLAGIGHWIGAGDQLRDLYALPMLISMAALPLTLYTFATISRRLGFAWARIDWGHGAVCLYAAALLLYSLRGIFALKLIYAACWQDVVWYQSSVPPGLACESTAVSAPAGFPLVLASVLAAYIGLGAGLWLRQRWPWLLAAMGTGIILLLTPTAFGPLPYFVGTSLCFCAMVIVAEQHTAAPIRGTVD